MTFVEYLYSKKIDSSAFKEKEESRYNELEMLFDQMHPDSFTAQKLYLLNPIRRKYNWKEKTESIKREPLAKPKMAKPKT